MLNKQKKKYFGEISKISRVVFMKKKKKPCLHDISETVRNQDTNFCG